jgi:hypothetical protein
LLVRTLTIGGCPRVLLDALLNVSLNRRDLNRDSPILLLNVENAGYPELMKRIGFVGLLITSLILSGTSASAATKATIVTAAFKSLLNKSANSLDALERKYESDIDALDFALNEASRRANSTYDADFAAASSVFIPQIAAINLKIAEAKAKFDSVSSVRVLSLGTNRNYWGNISCPTTRPDCKDAGDRGERFVVGEVTKIKGILATNSTDYLPEIDIMVAQGLIELLTPTEFRLVASTIKTEPLNINSLSSRFAEAQNNARNRQARSIEAADAVRASDLSDLDQEYETAKAQLEVQLKAAELALLAAKRASKDTASFDTAFVIAYKFEYNREMVGEIADAAWTGDWTFRTIDSIIKVNRLAVTGDSIGLKYSKKAASAFNAAVGNAFTNEPDFRAALKVVTATYKQATKVSLKF